MENKTLEKILQELQALNNNFSRGNFGKDSYSHPITRNKNKDKIKEEKENIEGLKLLSKDLSYSKSDRKEAKKELRQARLRQTGNYLGSTTGQIITRSVAAIANSVITVFETQIKKQTIKLQAASELQNRAIETYGKALNNAIGVQIGNVTGTVLDTAYNSLNAVIEGGRSIFMKNISDSITIRKQANETLKANIQMVGDIANSATGVISSIPGPVGLIGSALNMVASIGTKAAMLETQKTELRIKLDEEIQKSQNNALEQIESMVKRYMDMSKDVTKSFLDIGKSAYQYARTLGISSEGLKLYHDSLIEGINVQLSAFGMNVQDYIKMQESYNEANGGRSSILSTREAMMLGGLSMRLGISADQAATITGSMNVFNTSIADGSELMYSMAKTANRMGLSTNKFAKDLEKNLKLAEKYQFRGGVKGMMDMALWAQKTRFNIDEMSSLQEKMIGGNIEDVMQTSARLNVLGGNAALYSDPMALLFNGISNPAALAKNINSMVRGYGTFNRETGETEFSTNEILRMNAIAQGLGMSRENLMNQARQAQKSEVIKSKYGAKFGKDIEGITQHATWSKEKNDWIVKVNNPNKTEGYDEVALSSLHAGDERLKNIFPEDKQDRLITYVQEIRNVLSSAEKQAAAERNSIAVIMGLSNKKGLTEIQDLLSEARYADTQANKDKYSNIIMDISRHALKAQLDMNDYNTKTDTETLVNSYLEFTDSQFGALLVETTKFAASGANIERMLKEIAARYKGISVEEFERQENIKKNNLENFDYAQEVLDSAPFYIGNSRKAIIEQGIKDGRYYFENGELKSEDLRNGFGLFDFGKRWEAERLAKINDNIKEKKDITTLVKDAIITPRGTVYTHPDDMIAAFKPNGAIMNGLSNGVSKIDVSGTLMLKTENGQQVNLIELLRSDPESIRRITEAVIVEANKNNYGGRSKHAPGRFALN